MEISDDFIDTEISKFAADIRVLLSKLMSEVNSSNISKESRSLVTRMTDELNLFSQEGIVARDLDVNMIAEMTVGSQEALIRNTLGLVQKTNEMKTSDEFSGYSIGYSPFESSFEKMASAVEIAQKKIPIPLTPTYPIRKKTK